jgi:hypothetical protein
LSLVNHPINRGWQLKKQLNRMNYFHICSATLFAYWMTNAMALIVRISLFLPGLKIGAHDAELHRATTTGQYTPDTTPLQFLG